MSQRSLRADSSRKQNVFSILHTCIILHYCHSWRWRKKHYAVVPALGCDNVSFRIRWGPYLQSCQWLFNMLLRASELGSPTNHLGSRQRRDWENFSGPSFFLFWRAAWFFTVDLIVCVPVNQEVVYSSVIYHPFAYVSIPASNYSRRSLPRKLFCFMFQTSQRRH